MNEWIKSSFSFYWVELPELPFHKFRASRSGYQRVLYSSSASCDEFEAQRVGRVSDSHSPAGGQRERKRDGKNIICSRPLWELVFDDGWYPTGYLTISEPQKPSIDITELHRTGRLKNSMPIILGNVWSGGRCLSCLKYFVTNSSMIKCVGGQPDFCTFCEFVWNPGWAFPYLIASNSVDWRFRTS